MSEIIIDIKPREEGALMSGYVNKPLGPAVAALHEGGFAFIPVWLNAVLRQQEGYHAHISRKGNRAADGIYHPVNERARLLHRSLCLDNQKAAMNAHSQRQNYTELTQDQRDRAMAEGLEVKARDVNTEGNLVIPTNRFGDNEYAIHLFGGPGDDIQRSKRAQAYGTWLQQTPRQLQEITIEMHEQSKVDSLGKDYAAQIWLRNKTGGFNVVTTERSLHDNDITRGVKGSIDNLNVAETVTAA